MRGSFLDFTRGSQVAETVGMMFTTALRPMFWTVVGILLAAIAYQLWQHTDHGDRYFWMMHSYADVWHYFNFNPSHLIGLKMVAGDTVRVPISLINSYPPLIAAWGRLTTALTNGTVYGLGLGIPLAIIATIGLRRFGHDLTERKHTRGATIASVPELQANVAVLNAAASAVDSRKIASDLYGKSAPLKLTIPANRRHVRSLVHEPYTVAGVPYPWRAEQSHTMIVGTTGTGKSTAMKDLLRQIKARGDRAVVFDLTGTYVEGFYNKKTDVLLNPFDLRCPAWSPFADARTREHFKEVSQALIPMTENGDSFWQETARMLFVETCVRLVQQGRGNNKALAEVLMTSKLKDLHAHVARTIAAPLTDPEAKRMAESIRATFNTYAQALMTLPDEGAMFSIRDWVLGIDLDGRNGSDDGFDVLTETGTAGTQVDIDDADGEPGKPVIFDALTGEIFDDEDGVEVAGEPVAMGDDSSACEPGSAHAGPQRQARPSPDAQTADDMKVADRTPEARTEATGDDLPETPPGSVMFVAAQHVNMTSVRVLLTMWITTAINTLMSMRGDQRDIRLWFLIDEIGALHNIPAIVAGMQTSRNYGGAFVLGVHTMAQLRETYGDNHAETISSLAKTKLLLNTRDRGTQDWESEQIGEGEWSELEENWSYGVDNVRDAATLQRKIKLEPLVLPTEFGELPDLHGYLKFPQGLPTARVKLTYVKYRRQAPGFVERVIAPLALPGFEDETATPAPVSAQPAPAAPPPAPAPVTPRSVATHAGANSETTGNSTGENAPPAVQLKPNDGGEGFQTAVASDPPYRVPNMTNLAALPIEVTPSAPPVTFPSFDRLAAASGGNNAGPGNTTGPDQRTASEPAQGEDARTKVDPSARETTTVSLGIQELRASLQSRDRSHGKHHLRPEGNAAWAGRDGPAAEAATHSAAQRLEAEMAEAAVGRGDDDEYSR